MAEAASAGARGEYQQDLKENTELKSMLILGHLKSSRTKLGIQLTRPKPQAIRSAKHESRLGSPAAKSKPMQKRL